MQRLILIPTIALMSLLYTGCMSAIDPAGDMYIKGRWGQLETQVGERVKDVSSASTHDLVHLCTAYSNLKKYNKLFPCIEQLETNIKRGDSLFYLDYIPHYANYLRSLAFIDLSDYEKALTEAMKSYNIVIKEKERQVKGSYIGGASGVLSRTYKEKERKIKGFYIGEATGLLSFTYALINDKKNAIEYAKKTEDTDVGPTKSSKRMYLAKTYTALNDYNKAFQFLKEDDSAFQIFFSVLAVATGMIIPDDDFFAYFNLPQYFLLTKCQYELGNIKEAKESYLKLINTPQSKDNGEIYWMMLFDLGRIFEKEGKTKEAIHYYKNAIDVIEQQRSTINTEASKIGFVGDKQAVYHHLVNALIDDKQYERAFEYVERSKSRALVDILASKKDFAVKAGNDRVVTALLARNETAEMEYLIQDASLDKSKPRSVSIKIREELQKESPELASLMNVTSHSVSEIQNLIPSDEVLIEYYYRDKNLFAFVLSRVGFHAVRLNGDGLTEDIHQFRKSLETPGSSEYALLSKKLYQRLFKPLESATNRRNVLIVSHGALHYLPFNALHDGTSYFIDKYSVRTMPSASAMKYLSSKKANKAGDIIVFGNPDLGDPRHDLVNAQQEAIAVAKTRPKSKVFLRKEATEDAFRKYGSGFSYIHFATHGQFDTQAPLQSALLLAPDSESNGRITVEKLYSLRLDADLVTLSACETGLSKIANGDDLVGLTRGFLYTGCNSIVASLWKVDDLATSELMTHFYKEMDKTEKREALRTAQLETKKKYLHPYYWASFQLTGNAN